MYPRIIPSTKRILSSPGLSSSLASVRPAVALPPLGPSTHPAVRHATTFQTHSSDVYKKEVDTSPPEDTTMYHVNPEAPVQKWNKPPPSGDWDRRAGAVTNEHQPYAPPGGQAQRFGNVESWAKDKGPETSRRGEDPEGRSKT